MNGLANQTTRDADLARPLAGQLVAVQLAVLLAGLALDRCRAILASPIEHPSNTIIVWRMHGVGGGVFTIVLTPGGGIRSRMVQLYARRGKNARA